jgi:hypothetical protein
VGNAIRNAPNLIGTWPALVWSKRLGLPAIVVAAGPSLDKQLPLLRTAHRKALVLAVDGAIKPLVDAGVPMHAVGCIEALDKSHQLASAPPGIPRIVAVNGNPKHFSAGGGPAFPVVFAHAMAAEWLHILRCDALGAGSNVTNALMGLAFAWGAPEVVFVGNDLAYTDGRRYAEGHAGGGLPQWSEEWEDVDAWGGVGKVPTRIELNHGRWWLESVMRVLPDLRVTNATEGGARIAGTREETLASVLARLPDIEQPDLLAIAAASGPAVTRAEVDAHLAGEIDRVCRLLMACARTRKHARRLRRALGTEEAVIHATAANVVADEIQTLVNGATTIRSWCKEELDAMYEARPEGAKVTPKMIKDDAQRFLAFERALSEVDRLYRRSLREVRYGAT